MTSPLENVSMALFCDFENVALGVRDAKYDKFDIKRVLERLLLKGSIVVKKAYCDWDRYKSFKAAMHEANFELIEIPHVRQSGKNSADIRLVVDALDLCYTKAHVNTFVIISGDSDFSPLVSKLRENAKQVIGVGVKQSTSDLLIANCDEFIFYDDLVRDVQRAPARRESPEAQPAARRSPEEEARRREELEARRTEAIAIAVETFEALLAERGDSGKIWASMLKEAIKRRKPDFNESYYGFRAFGNLLEEAQARRLLELGRDEKSGTYVNRIAAVAEPERAREPRSGASPRDPERARERQTATTAAAPEVERQTATTAAAPEVERQTATTATAPEVERQHEPRDAEGAALPAPAEVRTGMEAPAKGGSRRRGGSARQRAAADADASVPSAATVASAPPPAAAEAAPVAPVPPRDAETVVRPAGAAHAPTEAKASAPASKAGTTRRRTRAAAAKSPSSATATPAVAEGAGGAEPAGDTRAVRDTIPTGDGTPARGATPAPKSAAARASTPNRETAATRETAAAEPTADASDVKTATSAAEARTGDAAAATVTPREPAAGSADETVAETATGEPARNSARRKPAGGARRTRKATGDAAADKG
jgi:uncharacterized LabA/DUF88 family protein